jgi:hypothetical protein
MLLHRKTEKVSPKSTIFNFCLLFLAPMEAVQKPDTGGQPIP